MGGVGGWWVWRVRRGGTGLAPHFKRQGPCKCEHVTCCYDCGCTAPLNWELGSGRVGSILDIGFSSHAVPTFYCCPGISHVSQVLRSLETRNPGAWVLGRIVQ